MDSLKSDIEAGRSLLLLVAQKGVGKTELLSRLANNLSDSVRSILLTHVSSRSLAHR
jgi:ATP-dependent Clp protease ATP-binding subunit ClpA